MKKIIIITISLFLHSWVYASDFKVGKLYFDISSTQNLTAKLVGADPTLTGALNIPRKVTYMNRVLTVTSVGEDAFKGNRRITSLFVPNTIEKMDGYSFRYCSFTKVTFEDADTDIDVHFSFDETSIGELYLGRFVYTNSYNEDTDAFNNLKRKSIRKVTIGPKVSRIIDFRLIDIKTLIIKNSKTIISPRAFDQDGIETLYLPDEYDNRIFFWRCPLTTIHLGKNGVMVSDRDYEYFTKYLYLNNPTPPQHAKFEDKFYGSATLYVPIGSKKAYAQHPEWGKFWKIVEYAFPKK